MVTNVDETPMGWEVNVLHLMLQATTVLVEDIDQQLHYQGEKFHREKKKKRQRRFP